MKTKYAVVEAKPTGLGGYGKAYGSCREVLGVYTSLAKARAFAKKNGNALVVLAVGWNYDLTREKRVPDTVMLSGPQEG